MTVLRDLSSGLEAWTEKSRPGPFYQRPPPPPPP